MEAAETLHGLSSHIFVPKKRCRRLGEAKCRVGRAYSLRDPHHPLLQRWVSRVRSTLLTVVAEETLSGLRRNMIKHCPSCKKQFAMPEGAIGKKVRCAGCQAVFVMEAPAAAI